MSAVSRRTFLKTSSVAVAAAGAAAAVPGAVAAALRGGVSQPSPLADPAVPEVGEPIIAHVRDARTGEIAVFVGERQVTVHDPDLAGRLAAATN
jgi:hypothetical protein